MDTEKRKLYRREWARNEYRANREKRAAEARQRRKNETPEQRALRLANMLAYREANKEKARARDAEWRANNKERIRENNLRRLGWSTEMFDARLAEQGGCCGICGTLMEDLPPKHRHADHCHTSGAARGVLCNSCNVGLGCFSDNPDLMGKAADYLRRHKENVK